MGASVAATNAMLNAAANTRSRVHPSADEAPVVTSVVSIDPPLAAQATQQRSPTAWQTSRGRRSDLAFTVGQASVDGRRSGRTAGHVGQERLRSGSHRLDMHPDGVNQTQIARSGPDSSPTTGGHVGR